MNVKMKKPAASVHAFLQIRNATVEMLKSDTLGRVWLKQKRNFAKKNVKTIYIVKCRTLLLIFIDYIAISSVIIKIHEDSLTKHLLLCHYD